MLDAAVIFPGQGSQAVGMGKDLADNFLVAREVFEQVDDILSERISKLIFEGPMEDLTQTRNTQPALMAMSMAVVKVLESELGKPIHEWVNLGAGHSLGEYSALTASGALSLEQATRLLRVRGDAMQSAVPEGDGAMAALIGGTIEQAERLCNEVSHLGVCMIANDNSSEQQVISGLKAAVEHACVQASSLGFKRAIPLNVSAPFHSSLMEPAAEVMKKALEETHGDPLAFPIVANVTADLVEEWVNFQKLLVLQVTGRVRWRETLLKFRQEGIATCYELGAGKVLAGLAKRTTPELVVKSVGTVDEIKEFVSNFR
ncbi:MAG: ACP S-malonyltransferase [Alphaproteobacteria bacterium]|nr:ACP S-malonyltransferase [Alphaproteobacteria bacterium]OJV46478.1 MAG: [acyl-carrier-protein] S-malonyltransferase [Alphaproteobacteria bacterium 43-37]